VYAYGRGRRFARRPRGTRPGRRADPSRLDGTRSKPASSVPSLTSSHG
jgi:hypothetical protein